MRIILIVTVLTFLGLVISCNSPKDNNSVDTRESIFDHASLLTVQQKDTIAELIRGLEKRVGSQIAIFTTDSLKGESINEFSLRTAEKLRLGRAEFDDGLLITVAVSNRQMRIEVGYGLENIIKDEIAARLIRDDMAPRFRVGDFSGGLKVTVEKVIKLIEDNKELVGKRR
ncbi:MAG TPA: TPM domain-containing protein [Chryseolinea sp.]|nr:TPM domain-containing protein [Chryseolinea sp.]